MTVLRDISLMWSFIHTLIMFLFLFDSRYPKKRTMTLTLTAMTPLILLNFLLFIFYGTDVYSKLMLVTLSLPSFIFFWILAKYRDGRFIFTFCMVDTIVLEIVYITNIIDLYIPGYIFMFVTRLIAYPLLELFIHKKFKAIYRDIQSEVNKGWTIFACIGVMFYISISLSMSHPVIITKRPEYLPAFVILLALMPISYINIFNTLRHQQKIYRSKEQENILMLQVSEIKKRVEEYSAANDNFKKERHDFRHKLQTISRMIETKKYDELLSTISKYNELLDETKVKKYCENAVLDAVLSSYLHKAENKGIKVKTAIHFPDNLPGSDAELATLLANAIENATNACEKTELSDRVIDIKIIAKPQFMIQISNNFDGNVEFDSDGIPIGRQPGHGLGTRSIVAFCNKYNAFYEFKVKDNNFIMQIMF